MKQLLLATLAATLLLAGGALAQRPDSPPTSRPVEAPKAFVFAGDPYLLPVDPTGVKLPALEQQLVVDHEGRELRFANEESLATFRAAPERFLARVDREMIADQLPLYPLMTCPISGEKLGGEMGEPIDVLYTNRLVRLCCKMCIKKFEASPDKVIERLNAAVTEQQARNYPLTTCPVSGEALEEGEIVDRVVSGRLIRLCCKMCTKKVAADPARFVHEVDMARAKRAREAEGGANKPKTREGAK